MTTAVIRPLTADDAGKRVKVTTRYKPTNFVRPYCGTLVWDDKTDPEHPIGLRTIEGSTQQADLWFKAGTEGEVLP
jgi:hypothetical protein